jgi:hypothetical protein
MTTAWSHLPNAALIDRVLADVQRRPDAWADAQDAAWAAAGVAARAAAWAAVGAAARDAAWAAAWEAAQVDAWGAAGDAAGGACVALVVWDDAAAFLDMPLPAVRLYAANGNHAAVLMLPATIVLSIKE